MISAARYGIPKPERRHVARRRLTDALLRAGTVPLVLVSAPAGTGKTSLIAEWAQSEAGGNSILDWISFDADDADLWTPIHDVLVQSGLDLSSVGPPSRERADGRDPSWERTDLRKIAAAIVQGPQRRTIVLDGYEMLSDGVARDVDFLLRHTLDRLCLVLVGRVDPLLPLYRYRLDDALVELRLADLAFTDAEAEELLHGMGVDLPGGTVHQLNERVQGWAVGLRLVARVLATKPRPEESVAAIVAEVRDINEYLVGEVLDAQTPANRRFLLETSVLDELTPDGVEQVAGAAARHTLDLLASANVFVEPVPQRPGCFRYYPFFRDLLRAQLDYEAPERSRELRRGLAEHYRDEGLLDEALAQLRTIEAWTDVADVMVDGLMLGRMLLEGRGGSLARLAELLPVRAGGAAVALVRAAAALSEGNPTDSATELASARVALADEPGTAATLTLGVLDAVHASLAEDAATARTAAEHAVRVAQSRSSSRAAAIELLALAQWSLGSAALRCGDLGDARDALARASTSEAARSTPSFRASCRGYQALVDALDGRLVRATRAATEALGAATDANVPMSNRSSSPYVALALVALEQYDLAAARAQITEAAAVSSLADEPFCRGLVEIVRAGLERAAGHVQASLHRIDAATTAAEPRDPWLADVLRVEAARVLLADGEPERALRGLEQLRSPEWPLAAVVAASAHAELAEEEAVAEYLDQPYEAHMPVHVQVSRLLVQGLHESRGRAGARARVAVERSLRLAAKERLRRPFRDASPGVQRLLAGDPRLFLQHPWVSNGEGSPAQVTADGVSTRVHHPGGILVEPLTAKELEVLGHLDGLLTTEEIASEMFVSVNTVKTHVRNILRKLNASRRNEAVRTARELHLLGGPDRSPGAGEDGEGGVRSAGRVEPALEI